MAVLVICKDEEDPIKIKLLEWPQYLSHYNPTGAICCHRNQTSDPNWPKTYCSLTPIPVMFLIKNDCNCPAGCRDI